jgi:hypothetical protein
MPAWSLREQQLTDAQKAVCEAAQSGDVMEDFRLWVPAADIQKLWDFCTITGRS